MVSGALLVFTHCPDEDTARTLARGLVEQRLAACVNVLAPCHSVYRWRDAVNEEAEVPLLIKTTAEAYGAVESFLRQRHPYELPEIVAVEIANGLPAYLGWLSEQVSAGPAQDRQ